MAIERQPGRGLWGGDLLIFDELASTNRWALDNIANCRRGDVIRALKQTAGVGRFGRSWICEPDSSLAFSIVIEPDGSSDIGFFYGVAAALTVRSFAAGSGARNVSVKWPNDVVADGRKFCGILLEQAGSAKLVLGIGLNVNMTPDSLRAAALEHSATSMAISAGRNFNLQSVFGSLLREMEIRLSHVSAEERPKLVSEWNCHDILAGRIIKVTSEETTVKGLCRGMSSTGQLSLQDEDGTEHLFWAGDATLAPGT